MLNYFAFEINKIHIKIKTDMCHKVQSIKKNAWEWIFKQIAALIQPYTW